MGKYQPYPEYKDSGVEWIGCIPKHWKLTRIKYITQCLDGARIPLNAQERGELQGDIPYWGANKIVDYVNDFLFDEELILLGEDGAPFFDDTKDVAFNVSGKIWPNNHVHVLRPDLKKIEPRFLKYALNCADYHLYISGSTRDKLNQSDMNEIYIRVTEVSELKQIANFLDHETAKIDTLIDKQQQLIQLLKEKRQAVISHAVTKGLNPDAPMRDSGVEWLGEVPEHWGVKKFKYLCKRIIAGPFGSSITKDMYVKDGYKVYGQEQVIPNDFEVGDYYISKKDYLALSRYVASDGDVLISCVGTFGKVAVFPKKARPGIINPRLIKAEIYPEHNPYYVRELLKSEMVYKQFELLSRGGTMGVINIAILNEILSAVPPTSEQQEIVEFINLKKKKFSNLIEHANTAVQLLHERRTALISAAVTGKIDVRGFELPQMEKETEAVACAL